MFNRNFIIVTVTIFTLLFIAATNVENYLLSVPLIIIANVVLYTAWWKQEKAERS